ncbi:MAG: hypothetical protein UY21_C0021G0015 [Microgenomates group bacterium GW2011_GWA1_48_10]|nr:MAG: hypothetical protein UY21_C0021G0015 [Microgenomates group bacterium GW2011_GWA1_48_10]
MKILYHIPYPGGIGDDRTIYDGYVYAFTDLGHVIAPFTERDSLPEIFRDVKPDFFITSLNMIQPHKNAETLRGYRRSGGVVLMKAGIFAETEKELFRLIREDYLADIYAAELEVPDFQRFTGKELRMLALAASRKYHFPAAPTKKYACDIVYVGANLPKKRDLFRRRLFPLMKKYDVKVFGSDWGILDRAVLHPLAKLERITLGTGAVSNFRIRRQVPYEEENQAYASAKISLNFHEQMGDGKTFLLNGRTFKIPASGGFEICDHVPLLRKYFAEDEVVMAKDDNDFFRKIDYYIAHEAEREKIRRKGTERALRDHTYHNRARLLLGWYEEIIRARSLAS